MEQKEYTRTILKASTGMVLTDENNTILAREICLGGYDSASNYYEITEEEAQRIREENGEVDYSWKPITFELAKERKLQEITSYDTSSNVNGFILDGEEVWLDKDTRVGLMNSITIEKSVGRETTTLWFGGKNYTIPCDTAIQMLIALEIYALGCYNATAQHKANVESLITIKDIDAYDYKSGYPEKLNLKTK